jgi:hypothetical protein
MLTHHGFVAPRTSSPPLASWAAMKATPRALAIRALGGWSRPALCLAPSRPPLPTPPQITPCPWSSNLLASRGSTSQVRAWLGAAGGGARQAGVHCRLQAIWLSTPLSESAPSPCSLPYPPHPAPTPPHSFVNAAAEYLAVGEAPDEIRNVCRQRSRWTKGHMQVRRQGFDRALMTGVDRSGQELPKGLRRCCVSCAAVAPHLIALLPPPPSPNPQPHPA